MLTKVTLIGQNVLPNLNPYIALHVSCLYMCVTWLYPELWCVACLKLGEEHVLGWWELRRYWSKHVVTFTHMVHVTLNPDP